MVLASYPGTLIAAAIVASALALLLLAYRAKACAQAGYWRVLFGSMQALALLALLFILWNPSMPQFVEKKTRNTVLTLVDSSRSMSMADVDGKPRLEASVEAIQKVLIGDNPEAPLFSLYGFDARAYPAQSSNALHRYGDRSDLHTALEAVRHYDLPREDDSAGQIVGAVVFTDGQVDDRVVTAYAPLQHQGIKLLFVGTGAVDAAPDVCLKSLRVPARALVETQYQAVLVLGKTGTLPGPVRVEVLSGNDLMFAQEVAPDAIADDKPVFCSLAASTLGPQPLTARIVPFEGEANPENNQRSAQVEVVDEEPINVLLYSHEASADIGKMRQALERDKKVRLDLGFDVLKANSGKDHKSMPGHVPFPSTPEAFNKYDVIILAAVQFSSLTNQQVDGLYSFVNDRGGGIAIMPSCGCGVKLDAFGEKLRSLLPAFPVQDSHSEGGSAIPLLTADGRSSRVFSDDALEKFQPTAQPIYASLDVKPASRTFLRGGDSALLVGQRLGRGYAALINLKPLATWYRADLDGGALRVLMSGLTAYLGRTTQRESGVELFAARPQGTPQFVRFDCTVMDRSYAPVSEANVLLETGGITYRMLETSHGRYTAEVNAGTRESISAHVAAEKDGLLLGERILSASVPLTTGEMDRTEQDREFLSTLAERMGGTYCNLPDLKTQAAGLFEASRSTRKVHELTPVWRRWAVFLAIAGTLTACWFLRRAKGLM